MNALCPCGSGKKFKNCHGRKEPTRSTRVVDAKATILEHLREHPGAQELAARVLRFYGASFQYHEDTGPEFSQFEINFDHEPTRFRSGVVRLRLGTNRMPEALTHELLHLQQPIIGFPRLVQGGIPVALKHHVAELRLFDPMLINIVDHEIMIDSFVELGFDGTRFLTPSFGPSDSDYKDHVEHAERRAVTEVTDFPWWCVEFYRHWLSERHGLAGSGKQAEMALRWGSRLYSDLDGVAARMMVWTERGDFRNPTSYAPGIEELSRITRIEVSVVRDRISRSVS